MLLTRKILSVMIAAAMMTASLPDVLATETTERDDEPKAIVSETFIDLEDHHGQFGLDLHLGRCAHGL